MERENVRDTQLQGVVTLHWHVYDKNMLQIVVATSTGTIVNFYYPNDLPPAFAHAALMALDDFVVKYTEAVEKRLEAMRPTDI